MESDLLEERDFVPVVDRDPLDFVPLLEDLLDEERVVVRLLPPLDEDRLVDLVLPPEERLPDDLPLPLDERLDDFLESAMRL